MIRGEATGVSKVSDVSKVALPPDSGQANVSTPIKSESNVDTEAVAFSPFVNSIYNTDGLLRFLDEITLIQRSLFRDKGGPISLKARDFTSSGILYIFEEVEKTGLEPETDQKQMKFLKDLATFVKKLPVVKISIAFEPTNTFLMKLNSQISAAVGTKVILDVVINQYLIGGAVIEYNGKAGKYTLEGPLEEALRKGLEVSRR